MDGIKETGWLVSYRKLVYSIIAVVAVCFITWLKSSQEAGLSTTDLQHAFGAIVSIAWAFGVSNAGPKAVAAVANGVGSKGERT